MFCAPRGIRTPDPLLKRQVLCQTELWAQMNLFFLKISGLRKVLFYPPSLRFGGRQTPSSRLPFGFVELFVHASRCAPGGQGAMGAKKPILFPNRLVKF